MSLANRFKNLHFYLLSVFFMKISLIVFGNEHLKNSLKSRDLPSQRHPKKSVGLPALKFLKNLGLDFPIQGLSL